MKKMTSQITDVILLLLKASKKTFADVTLKQIKTLAERSIVCANELQEALQNAKLYYKKQSPINEKKLTRRESFQHINEKVVPKRPFKHHALENKTSNGKVNLCFQPERKKLTKNLTLPITNNTKLYKSVNFCKKSKALSDVPINVNKKTYKCCRCFCTFTKKANIKSHLRSHAHARRFRCCKRNFASYNNFRVHLILHKWKKLIVCNLCNKKFCPSAYQKTHSRAHRDLYKDKSNVFLKKFHNSGITTRSRSAIKQSSSIAGENYPKPTHEKKNLHKKQKFEKNNLGTKRKDSTKVEETNLVTKSRNSAKVEETNLVTKSRNSAKVEETNLVAKRKDSIKVETNLVTKRKDSTKVKETNFVSKRKNSVEINHTGFTDEEIIFDGQYQHSSLGKSYLPHTFSKDVFNSATGIMEKAVIICDPDDYPVKQVNNKQKTESIYNPFSVQGKSDQSPAFIKEVFNSQTGKMEEAIIICDPSFLNHIQAVNNPQSTESIHDLLTSQANNDLPHSLSKEVFNTQTGMTEDVIIVYDSNDLNPVQGINSQLKAEPVCSPILSQVKSQFPSTYRNGNNSFGCSKNRPNSAKKIRSPEKETTFIVCDRSIRHQSGRRINKCSICGHLFKTEQDLSTHKYTVHVEIIKSEYMAAKKNLPGRVFCPQCPKSYRDNSGLSRHIKDVHLGIKNHACSHCGMLFSRLYQCREHEITHTSLKPYKCPHCDNTFTQARFRNKHITLHHGET